MRLSTKSRYAVTAMLDLALNEGGGPMTLGDIAENQNVSLSYLEQLFAQLRAKGLVRGVRGPGGGYYLARDAGDISIAEVICAVDEWVDYTHNPERGRRAVAAPCHDTRSLWQDLSDQIFDHLAGITLRQLVRRAGGRSPAGENTGAHRAA